MANPTMPELGESAAEALGGTVNSGTGIKHQAFGIDDEDTPSAFSRLMNREHNVCIGLAALEYKCRKAAFECTRPEPAFGHCEV